VTNTGNVKLRGLQLFVPPLAKDSSDNSIICTISSTGSAWTAGSILAANSSLSCSGSFSFSQDAIEVGHISPVVTVAGVNLAAAVSMPLPTISVPNTPSLSVSVDTSSCVKPENAGA
jgi:hypothetical protein